jgi:hypothetical protein
MALSARARAAIAAVLASLDLQRLADVYCEHGGAAFWADRLGPVRELGCEWARALTERLAPGGVSLYVGAGVAELPALITEVLDLGRTVRASNLRAVEVEVVNHAMAAHGLPELLVCADARELSPSHDHLNMVSVLSDPETFPMVSGIAYGRLHPVHVDVDELVRERADVEALVDGVCRGLSLPGLITTTVEEVPWLLAWAEAKGFVIEPDEAMIETAIVGDPIGFLRVQARPSA